MTTIKKTNDPFLLHTQQQRRKHFISGMHEPFLPTTEQRLFFTTHFSHYQHLLPETIDLFQKQQALKTPVQIRPLSQCPVSFNTQQATLLAIGGPAALVWAASKVKQQQPVTYVNDERRMPIAYGSAWHLEEDAETEAATTYKPSTFMCQQILRACHRFTRYSSIAKTGFFPWRTLDWSGWLRHPSAWLMGIRIALYFQSHIVKNIQQRDKTLSKLAQQCHKNETFYNELNEDLEKKLLLPGNGSIIVARNTEEISALAHLKNALSKENRVLMALSKEDLEHRYGYSLQGEQFAEKSHDRMLSPNALTMLKTFIAEKDGQVLNGTLIAFYADKNSEGGIAEYYTTENEKKYIHFNQLVLSLGSQMITDYNHKPLFDLISARGVSMLAYIYLPQGWKLAPATVCGDTNHVTKLSEQAISTHHANGEIYDLYLVRMTAGACITPTVSEKDAVNYDGSVAFGLLTAVRKTFGDQCHIEPITAYGCNRQVNHFGETQWLNPFPHIHIQYGAGGGGLTRAPDFCTQ